MTEEVAEDVTVVGWAFSPDYPGMCLRSVGLTKESHGPVNILLMSDGSVRWEKKLQ